MTKSMYQLTSDNNSAIKEVLDSLIELNAHKVEAEKQGWTVEFMVQQGDVDVTISRDAWPVLDGDE